MYINRLDDIVNEHNSTYHSKIKVETVDVKSSTYIDFNKENNDEDPKFEVSVQVRISKYKNIFMKGYTPNWSEEVFFVIEKVKYSVPRRYVINVLNCEEIVGTFQKKELQKTNKKNIRVGKVTKRKGDKLCAKWKCYDDSFNSWIDKKCIII